MEPTLRGYRADRTARYVDGQLHESLKEHLHRLIDALPENKLGVAEEALAGLFDPMVWAHLIAPDDDEPTTPEKDEGATEAWQEYRRGDGLSADEAKRLLLA